jgi:hypothetical protein
MSLDIKVYCKQVSSDLVPKVIKRLNDYDMDVEVHPEFKFDEEADTGFIPFKFRLKNPPLDILKGKDLKSGFELYIDDFNLAEEKESLKPRISFFDKLRGKKQAEIDFAPPEIEKRLQHCKKSVSFVWHAGDSFQFRFACLTSAILTELSNGIRCYASDEIWYENKNISNGAFKEVTDYEKSLPKEEIEFQEFDRW